MMSAGSGHANLGNSDIFFDDVPAMGDGHNSDSEDERFSQRLQAPPVPGTTDALEDVGNAVALAELEDVPMAAKKRKTINRGPKLDAKRLLSSRGLPAIPSYFENVQLKGKGHEEEDLALVMSHLEHWAHRLYPKITFDDCLEKIESLGHKKEVQTCLKKIRMGERILDDENQSTVITADGPPVEDVNSDMEVDYGVTESSDVISDLFAGVPRFTQSSQPDSNQERTGDEDMTSQPSTSADTSDVLSGFHPSS